MAYDDDYYEKNYVHFIVLNQLILFINFDVTSSFVIVCFGGQYEKQLLHQLLDSYNTLERPVANESDPLQLSFGLTLMQIIDVVSNHSSSQINYQV